MAENGFFFDPINVGSAGNSVGLSITTQRISNKKGTVIQMVPENVIF